MLPFRCCLSDAAFPMLQGLGDEPDTNQYELSEPPRALETWFLDIRQRTRRPEPRYRSAHLRVFRFGL